MISLKLNTVVFSFIVICVGCNGHYGGAHSFVDPHVVLQEEFEGWGTSLAWWADVVGGMEPEIVDHVVDALFSPSKLNLNIARYVIGGTTPDNYTCGDYRDGAASESFKDGFDSPYNWNRDLRQRKILESAKAKGANLFEAFSNTPLQWLSLDCKRKMTISGCSKGNSRSPPLNSNFDASNSPHFADYATEVIKYFHESLNITFSTYSPFNEPFGLHGIGGWVGASQQQEGCNMGRPTMVSVIKSVHEALVSKNLTFLKIAISDETQVNTQVQSYNHFVEANVSKLFQQVNVHGYWDNIEVSRKDLLSLRCSKAGHGLWMDEMGWAGTPVDDMEQGLNIATRIVTDLRTMIPSAWVYWQAVEDAGAWGLLDVPFQNTSLNNIRYNSGYFSLEQFSQHIRQGYKLIHASDANTVAALGEDMQKLVLVTVNSEETDITLDVDLGLFESIGSVKLFRTSATEQHVNLPPPPVASENKVELLCPPQSITTLEISNVALAGGNITNLIENGNFESVSENGSGTRLPTSWLLVHEGNGAGDDGVTEQNPWRGEFSGILGLGPLRNSRLLQTVDLSLVNSTSQCSFYLSAWCSSTQPGTKLGVLVNGGKGVEIDIGRNGVYNSYGISFSASANETIQVYFTNSGTLLSGSAKIDSVNLHAKCA